MPPSGKETGIGCCICCCGCTANPAIASAAAELKERVDSTAGGEGLCGDEIGDEKSLVFVCAVEESEETGGLDGIAGVTLALTRSARRRPKQRERDSYISATSHLRSAAGGHAPRASQTKCLQCLRCFFRLFAVRLCERRGGRLCRLASLTRPCSDRTVTRSGTNVSGAIRTVARIPRMRLVLTAHE